MPFKANKDLPTSVKGALPAAAQTVFRNVANSQLSRGLSEERSFASAWSALKNQGWKKQPNGKWKKVKKMQKANKQTGETNGHTHTFNDSSRTGETSRVNGHTHSYDLSKGQTASAGGHTHSISVAKSDIHMTATIEKTDDDQNLVFGWFSIIEKDGEEVVDSQGDVITEEELEKAMYDFVLNARDAGEMHMRKDAGKLVECMVFTKQKQELMGIDLGFVGAWGGFKLDDDTFAKVKSGKYSMFSIGGRGTRE